MAQFSTSAWTGDASANVSTATNLWAYNLGSASSATVNGVTFTGVAGASPAVSGKFSLNFPTGILTGDTNNITSLGGLGSAVMATDFVYDANPATLTLEGLTVGQVYELNVYTVGWEAAGNRFATWSSGGDSANLDVDQFGDNNGSLVKYSFTASGSTRTITITPLTAATWHFYGIALNAVRPEISVEEPVSTVLVDGSSTIAFGSIRQGETSSSKTITIRNLGNEDLGISNVTLDGTHSGDFATNLTSLDGTVVAGGSTTFTVSFTPLAAGARSAVLHILSDDADEGSFDINLSGTGTIPLISVKGNNTAITNGDSTPASADHTDFGSTPVTGGSVTRTFTISNTGTAQLVLTGAAPDYVTLTGSTDFTVTSQPSTPVAATSGTTTFQVTYNPATSGASTATVSIDNDDGSADPYTFVIQGTGTEPPTLATPTSDSLTPSAATLGGDVTDDG